MNSREHFVKAESKKLRAFMDRHANDDFRLPPGSVTYSRKYACDCGFATHDAGKIFDHAITCKEPCRA